MSDQSNISPPQGEAQPDADAKSGRRVLKMTGWFLGPKTVGAVLSLVYLAMITRSLGLNDFGRFAIMLSFVQAVCALASFQTWQLILRYGTKAAVEEDRQTMGQLTSLCLLLDGAGIMLGLLLAIGGALIAGPGLGWTGEETLALFGLTAGMLLATRSTPMGLLRVHDRFSDGAYAEMIVPILRMVLVPLLIWLGGSPLGFLAVWVASELVCAVLVWVMVAYRLRPNIRRVHLTSLAPHRMTFPEWGQFAIWTNIGTSLRFLSQNVMVVVVGFFTGDAEAGLFRLGHQIGQVLARVADGVSVAVFTEYSRINHASQDKAGQKLIKRTVAISVIGTIALLAIGFAVGRPVLSIFGQEFIAAFPYLLLLGSAATIQMVALAFEASMMADGHAARALTGNLVGAVSLVLLLALTMPSYAAIGAAWSVLLAALISGLAFYLIDRRLRRSL